MHYDRTLKKEDIPKQTLLFEIVLTTARGRSVLRGTILLPQILWGRSTPSRQLPTTQLSRKPQERDINRHIDRSSMILTLLLPKKWLILFKTRDLRWTSKEIKCPQKLHQLESPRRLSGSRTLGYWHTHNSGSFILWQGPHATLDWFRESWKENELTAVWDILFQLLCFLSFRHLISLSLLP